MNHLPVERARYQGELRYSGVGGEHVERISIDCTTLYETTECTDTGPGGAATGASLP